MAFSMCRWTASGTSRLGPLCQYQACGVLSADQGVGGHPVLLDSESLVEICQGRRQRRDTGSDLALRVRSQARMACAWRTSGALTRCHAADMASLAKVPS